MLLTLVSFTAAAALLVVLPGPDTLVVIRSLVRGGQRSGMQTTAGVLCSLTVWVSAASLGLSALLQASHTGYDILRCAGALYLFWMGARSIRSLTRAADEDLPETDGPLAPARQLTRTGFSAGFLTDILNPKVGVFFVSFLPAFVPHGYPIGWFTLGLGVWYIVLTLIWFTCLIAATSTIAALMQTPRIRRRIDALTSMVLIGFAVRLAIEA